MYIHVNVGRYMYVQGTFYMLGGGTQHNERESSKICTKVTDQIDHARESSCPESRTTTCRFTVCGMFEGRIELVKHHQL